MDAVEFAEAVYGACPETDWIGLWTKSGRRTKWFENRNISTELVAWNGRYANDVYWPVSTTAADMGSKRGEKAARVRLVCIALDVDTDAKEAKVGKTYPPLAIAWQAIREMPLTPSLVIHSGRGLQPVWIFHEPLELTGQAEAIEQGLILPWLRLLESRLARHGDYDVDHTQDVTRVYRLPGSRHSEADVEVTYSEVTGGRFSREDFEEFFQETNHSHYSNGTAIAPNGKAAVVVDSLLFSDESNKAAELMKIVDAMCEADKRFRDSWHRRRSDFTDQSPSTYCYSLTNFCLSTGMQDQRIADLIIAWRGKHGCLNDDRNEVIRKIHHDIRMLKAERSTISAGQMIERAADPSNTDKSPEERRSEAIAGLSDFLQVKVARWLKVGKSTPVYYLEIDDGRRIMIGPSHSFVSGKTQFAARLMDECNVTVKAKPKEWPQVLKGLCAIVEEIEAEDLSDVVSIKAAIEFYLDRSVIWERQHWFEALKGNHPIQDGPMRGFSFRTFMKFCRDNRLLEFSESRAMAAVKMAGLERIQITERNPDDGDDRLTRNYWKTDVERLSSLRK